MFERCICQIRDVSPGFLWRIGRNWSCLHEIRATGFRPLVRSTWVLVRAVETNGARNLYRLRKSLHLGGKGWGRAMPYFERKPYDAMKAAAALPGPGQAASVVDLAQRVLQSETTDQAPVYGPFRCARTCAPGSQDSLTLSISSLDDAAELVLHPGRLEGPGGRKISASHVTISPSTLRLKDGDIADVKVTLSPPPDTAPGLYGGTIEVTGTAPALFRIAFEVGLPR